MTVHDAPGHRGPISCGIMATHLASCTITHQGMPSGHLKPMVSYYFEHVDELPLPIGHHCQL